MQHQEPINPGNGPKPGQQVSQIALHLCNYGGECRKAQQFDAAVIALRRCVAMHPDVGLFWANLGAALLDVGSWQEAIDCLIHSHQLDPTNVNTVGNLALALAQNDRYDESMEQYAKACQMDPDDAFIHWNQACAKLSYGHWKEALPEYDKWRPRALGNDVLKDAPFPYWDGKQDLNGKTLFLQFEQGLGDRIIHSRFVYCLKQRYPQVQIYALAYDRMNPILWGFQEDAIMTLMPEKVRFPKADYCLYAADLMRIIGIVPDNIPPDPGIILKSIAPTAEKFSGDFPMPLVPSVKVGVCWTGNPLMARNKERTIPLELILRLAELPNVTLYSLQAGAGAQDVDRLGAKGLMHSDQGFGADLERKGLTVTATLILNLDVVITCCTSVAHLAGVLGVPTWTVLCYDPYWIWLRKGDTTPWYPSMTLFRQPRPGDWNTVMTEVKERLRQTADELTREIAT
jgi:Tetratricopeptide repeat